MKKLTTRILIAIIMLMIWQGDLIANNQTVTLKLYKRQINTTGAFSVTLLNQQTTESSILATYNCSDDFIAISASLKYWDNIHSDANNASFINPAITEYYYEINIPLPIDTNEKYWVGKQIAGGGGLAFQGVNIFSFKNVKGKILLKGNQATFKYVDDLYFGAWIPPNTTVTYTDCSISHTILVSETNSTSNYIRPTASAAINGEICNESVRCDIGQLIYCESCINVEIDGFNIDGSTFERNNNANTLGNNITDPLSKIGGKFGDVGWQTNHTGIAIVIDLAYLTGIINNPSSFPTQTLIKNCNTYNLGLDGILVQNFNVTMKNCNMYNNCRQGLSWIGGDNLTAIDCNFYNQAKILNTSPGAGIDIEPEMKNSADVILDMNNGKFTNCNIYDNGQWAVSNYGGTNTIGVEFINCKFSQPENYTLMVEGKKIKFTNCEFRCMVWKSNNGNTLGDETKFYNCDFYDIDIHGVPLFNSAGGDVTLYDNTNGKRTLLDSCRFHIDANKPRNFISLSSPNGSSVNDYVIIKNCNFTNNQPSLTDPNPINGNIISGAKFEGKNEFINHTNKVQLFSSYDLIFEGSNDACDPNETIVDGKIAWQHKYDNLYNNKLDLGNRYTLNGNFIDNEGYTKIKFFNNAEFSVISWVNGVQANMNIGKNSAIITGDEGRIGLHNANISHFGKIICEKNSHFCFNSSTFNRNPPFLDNTELYIDKDAIPLNNTPIVCNGIIAGYPTSINPKCIQGGNQHPDISQYHCNSLYKNIQTNLSFTLLYNKTDVLCGGGNTGSFDISVSGGTAPLSIVCTAPNGSILTPPYTGLTGGGYNIHVTDANGCSADFNVEITEPATALSILNINQTNILCNGLATGAIVPTATGGSGNLLYSINNGVSFQTSNVFSNLTANNYTITVTDANGCTTSSTVTITQPNILSSSISNVTNVTCNGLSNGIASATGVNGTAPYTYVWSNGVNTNTNNTLNAATHTVTVTDANGCTASSTVTITQPNILSSSISNVTNVSCNGLSNGIASATGVNGTAPYTYVWSNGVNTNTNNTLNAGTHTVTVTDANGCTTSSTVTITEPATALTWLSTSFTNLPCTGMNDGIIDVVPDGGTLPYEYELNSSGFIYTNGYFAPLQAGTYTITVKDANSCTLTYTTILNSPTADMCNSCNMGQTLVSTPNIILLNNPTANSIIYNYNNGNGMVTGKSFYISGILTIDHSITFDACNIYFAPGGSVFLNPTFNLDLINNTIMDAACDWWGGIVAVNASNKITMNTDATIKKSAYGIHALDNAILEIENAHFIDNGETSLYLANMTLNPYPGFIKHNTFTTQTNLLGQWSQNEKAIELLNVKNINIGDITDANSGNNFSNMKTGIAILNDINNGNSQIGIYNNNFYDIHANFPLNLTQTQADAIVKNCYTNKEGAAIYADVSYIPTQNVHIDVSNTVSQTQTFMNCDKAIVVVGASLNATKLTTNNCLLGIMCSSPFSRNFRIRNNDIVDAHIGIELFGRQSRSTIEENTIKTANGFLTNQLCPSFKAPIGIRFQNGTQINTTNNNMINHSIANNFITVKAVAGIGIHNAYANADLQTEGNTILLSTNNANNGAAMFFNRKDLIGIYGDVCVGSIFKENLINGPTLQNVWAARDTKGIIFSQGHDNVINCNKALYTRFGFYVWGDNGNSDPSITNKVTYNKMGANKYPWWFEDFNSTQSGTFGNIGDIGQDNYNEFKYGSNTTYLNPNGFKIYRNSIFPGDEIWTDPSRLTSFESGASVVGKEYFVQDAQQGVNYTDPCVYNNVNNPAGNITDEQMYHDLSGALAVAQENVDYINFPIVGGWIDKQTLYNQLANDEALRNSDPDLLLFYNTYNVAPIGQIYLSDLALQYMADSNITDLEFLTRYNTAMAQTNAIVSNDSWEINERIINVLEAKLMRFGLDSLNEEDTTYMHQLAQSCPFVAGTAVYKARVLWSNFEPDALFDDRVICMPQVLGKNADIQNANINIDSLLLSQAEGHMETIQINAQHTTKNEPTQLHVISKEISDIRLYPNPAINSITFDYESTFDGQVEIYNAMGEKIVTQKLFAHLKKQTINIEHLANGVYQYKIRFTDGKNSIGKFTIKK